jgi:predicted nucleic acid-binding protein
VGDDHPHREPCRAVVERAQAGRLVGAASPDLLQEFLHQRARRTGDRAGASALARDVARLCRFDDLSDADALRALDLFDRHERLSARDAVFAAFALNRGIDTILSVDTDLDGIDGLTRVDPADSDALEALTK